MKIYCDGAVLKPDAPDWEYTDEIQVTKESPSPSETTIEIQYEGLGLAIDLDDLKRAIRALEGGEE